MIRHRAQRRREWRRLWYKCKLHFSSKVIATPSSARHQMHNWRRRYWIFSSFGNSIKDVSCHFSSKYWGVTCMLAANFKWNFILLIIKIPLHLFSLTERSPWYNTHLFNFRPTHQTISIVIMGHSVAYNQQEISRFLLKLTSRITGLPISVDSIVWSTMRWMKSLHHFSLLVFIEETRMSRSWLYLHKAH